MEIIKKLHGLSIYSGVRELYLTHMTQKLGFRKIDQLGLKEEVLKRTIIGESVRTIAKELPVSPKTVNRYQKGFVIDVKPEWREKLNQIFGNMLDDLVFLRTEAKEKLEEFSGEDNQMYVKMFTALVSKLDKDIKAISMFIPTKSIHAEIINKREVKEYVIRSV